MWISFPVLPYKFSKEFVLQFNLFFCTWLKLMSNRPWSVGSYFCKKGNKVDSISILYCSRIRAGNLLSLFFSFCLYLIVRSTSCKQNLVKNGKNMMQQRRMQQWLLYHWEVNSMLYLVQANQAIDKERINILVNWYLKVC